MGGGGGIPLVAVFPRWREPGKIGKYFATLHHFAAEMAQRDDNHLCIVLLKVADGAVSNAPQFSVIRTKLKWRFFTSNSEKTVQM